MVQIEEYIPVGHANAIKRADLVALFPESDVTVRAMIRDARQRGVIIINLQDGAGYFKPARDEGELVRQAYKQEYNRAMGVLKSIKQLHALVDDFEGKRLDGWVCTSEQKNP